MSVQVVLFRNIQYNPALFLESNRRVQAKQLNSNFLYQDVSVPFYIISSAEFTYEINI